MPQKKSFKRAAPGDAASAKTERSARPPNPSQREPPPTVSGRWLIIAASIAILAAGVCGWLTLCLLFWQGSWQMLYHPSAAITRTPASVGVGFEPVAFAATEAGLPRLKGWWIPAAAGARYGRFTVLYLHGQGGNLSDAVDALAALHRIGVNILAFDYRGYGQSQFARPSEARWREDAEWALTYLTATRHVPASNIVINGEGLGANLALEVAVAHPDLAGVVLDSPAESPVDAIFADPRARLVPAHLLARDRFSTDIAMLRIPSLWVHKSPTGNSHDHATSSSVHPAKMTVWVEPSGSTGDEYSDTYTHWLDDLANDTHDY